MNKSFIAIAIVIGLLAVAFGLSACASPQPAAPAPQPSPPAPDAGQAAPAPQPTTPDTSAGATPAPSPVAVTIQGFAFSPAQLHVSVGQSVTWTNQDSAPHTVTSDTGSELASSDLSQGQSYTHTFNTPGTYAYHCGVHPSMKATVIVT